MVGKATSAGSGSIWPGVYLCANRVSRHQLMFVKRSGLEHGSRNPPPTGLGGEVTDFQEAELVNVDIRHEQWVARRIDAEHSRRAPVAVPCPDVEKDHPADCCVCRLPILDPAFRDVVHRGVCVFQMPKRMEDPVPDHGKGVVTFIELPLVSRIRNHALHDVVPGHEVDEKRPGFRLQAGMNLRQFQ